MKTIGLLGGLTYNSTLDYYKKINQKVNEKLGKGNSARLVLNSINYQEIKDYNYQDWVAVGEILKRELLKLQSFGVNAMLMCNNTLHKPYGLIENDLNLSIPYFHIVDAVGKEAVKNNYQKLLLLGTKFTMTDGFYQQKLTDAYGLEVIIPEPEGVDEVNRIIQTELTFGNVLQESKENLQAIINKHNCDAVILGCTELPLIIQPDDCAVPVLDTVEIHCNQAVEFILG